MRANEVRIGNLVYYHTVNEIDKRKGWDEVIPIDQDDILLLVQYKDMSLYKPIPLSEELLLKFGFNNHGRQKNCYYKSWGTNGVECIVYEYHYNSGFEYELSGNRYKTIEFVHQLQNLYFALTGEELEVKLWK